MSRALLVTGLILSIALHVSLLRLPSSAAAPSTPPPPPTAPRLAAAAPTVVPILETTAPPDRGADDAEAAAPVEPVAPEPEPQRVPTPEPVLEPAPEPAQEPAPALEPVAVPEPEVADPEPTAEPERPPARTDAAAAGPTALARTAEAPTADHPEAGDFAGRPDGPRRPALRIDWGSVAHALATIEHGAMRVVVLAPGGERPIIVGAVQRDADRWVRRPYQPAAGSMRYSNRLRVVDDVPAFAGLRRAANLGRDEHLAVLVPVELERRFESAQLGAAFARGLTMGDVRSFGGRFAIVGEAVRFEITHVGEDVR